MPRLAILIALVSLLSACDPFSTPESMMDTYTSRLAYVLDADVEPITAISIEALPRPRDRRVEIEQLDISMLAFLSLYGCELQVVVAERNSILGRVMTPLNELRYQLRFIDKAQQCLPMLEDDSLRQQLTLAIQHKRERLSAYFWNAIWSDEPMTVLLTRSKGLFSLKDNEQVSVLNEQLDTLIRLSQQLDTINDETAFEDVVDIQQNWVFNPLAGQLVNSASLLIRTLNHGSELMQQRIENKPLCYQHKPNTQSENLKGLFFSVYIGRVQPYLAKTAQAGEQVFSRLQQLAGQQGAVMPEGFKLYYQNVLTVERAGTVWQQLDDAIRLHTRRWQQLFSQCGMQPVAG